MFNLKSKIGYNYGKIIKYYSGTANTAIQHHGKKTYALEEDSFPFQVKVDKDSKEFDIKSIGYDNFNGELKHNVTAHPKIDKKTGELFVFGYDINTGSINYSVFNNNKKLLHHFNFKISSPRIIHDWMITENYVIVPDSPLEFCPDITIKENKFAF